MKGGEQKLALLDVASRGFKRAGPWAVVRAGGGCDIGERQVVRTRVTLFGGLGPTRAIPWFPPPNVPHAQASTRSHFRLQVPEYFGAGSMHKFVPGQVLSITSDLPIEQAHVVSKTVNCSKARVLLGSKLYILVGRKTPVRMAGTTYARADWF